MRYRIWFVNFGYPSEQPVLGKDKAVELAKQKGFEAAIQRQVLPNGEWETVGRWSPIGGYREM